MNNVRTIPERIDSAIFHLEAAFNDLIQPEQQELRDVPFAAACGLAKVGCDVSGIRLSLVQIAALMGHTVPRCSYKSKTDSELQEMWLRIAQEPPGL